MNVTLLIASVVAMASAMVNTDLECLIGNL